LFFSKTRSPRVSKPVVQQVAWLTDRSGNRLVQHLPTAFSPNAHLVLVGEGPDESMLKEKVNEFELSDNVSFFEFTREPVYVFERIDILVLPSLYKEGLPNVLLEAMAMKTPVISSRMAGVPEVVKTGETGFMIEPGNKDELTEAIVNLCSDVTLLNQMGENGRRMMEEKFDKQVQFEEFLQFFNKVTGK